MWVGEGADVHPDATITGPAVIGDNCRIEAGATVGEYTVLGSNVRVRNDAFLERTVVHDNVYLGDSVRLRGTVVGRSCDLRNGVRIEEGVVIGDECFVGEEAQLGPGVKVYPFKTVEAGAVVNESIVWETRGARSLFGSEGVSGLANVDITPEFAVRVAMAYGGMLKKGSTVVTSRDSSRSARMLKRAMMAGLNGVGVNVEDLEVATVPVTRFIMRRPAARGGLTVRLANDDPQSVVIRFFDEDGLDITEETQRKIERLFAREDFRRVFPGEIGDIGFPPRALEHYTTALESTVDVVAIRNAAFKVVIDYTYGSTSFVMPNVLAKLGLEVLAVNPFVSTAGVLRADIDEHARQVGDLVRTSGSQLGGVIDPDGERPAPHRRRGPRPQPHRVAPGHPHAPARQPLRRSRRPPGEHHREGREAAAGQRHRRDLDQALQRGPDGRLDGGRRRLRRRTRAATSSSPASCPASTPPPPS